MSKANKCDRCGKCFDPVEEEGEMCWFRMPLLYTAKNVTEMTRGNPLKKGSAPDDLIDMCPDCTKLFKIFMKPTENGGDTDGDEKTHADLPSDTFDNLFRNLFCGGGK